MGGSVGAYRDTAMGAGHEDIELPVADRGSELVEIAARGEYSVGSEDRDLTFLGQACGHAGPALFRDPHAEPPVLSSRAVLVKLADRDRVGDVRAEADHALVVTGI